MGDQTIYLIHLDHPLGQAQPDSARSARGLPPRKRAGYTAHSQHYIGKTTNLKQRIEEHRSGTGKGARFLYAATQAGIDWQVVRKWKGPASLERELKNRKNARAMCPVCNPDGWKRNAAKKGK